MPFDGSAHDAASPVTQLLARGRERVQRGWCQHSLIVGASVCLTGSLCGIRDGESGELFCRAFLDAENFLLEAIVALGYTHLSLVGFNDEPGRTKEQVLEVFDRAIELSMPPWTAWRRRFIREALAA